VAPTNGFSEVHAPPAWLETRGFAPHTYHPIPLQLAFHVPSRENLDMVKR